MGRRNVDRGESSLRGEYPGLSAHKDNPRSAAVGRNRSVVLEPLEGTVRGSGVVECQHKCIRETISLTGSLSAGDTC